MSDREAPEQLGNYGVMWHDLACGEYAGSAEVVQEPIDHRLECAAALSAIRRHLMRIRELHCLQGRGSPAELESEKCLHRREP